MHETSPQIAQSAPIYRADQSGCTSNVKDYRNTLVGLEEGYTTTMRDIAAEGGGLGIIVGSQVDSLWQVFPVQSQTTKSI